MIDLYQGPNVELYRAPGIEAAGRAAMHRAWQDWTPVATTRVAIQVLFLWWCRFMLRLRVEGTEHVPRRGRVIFAPNHRSHADTPAVLAAIPWRRRIGVAPGAAADVFFENAGLASVMRLGFNALAVARRGEARHTMIDALSTYMASSPRRALLLFPEGGRYTPNQSVSTLKKGVAWIALSSGARIVPVGIRGTEHVLPKGRNWPRRNSIPARVRFGVPLDPAAFIARHPGDRYAQASALTAALRSGLLTVLKTTPPGAACGGRRDA